jgi:hypothetical protein
MKNEIKQKQEESFLHLDAKMMTKDTFSCLKKELQLLKWLTVLGFTFLMTFQGYIAFFHK